MFCSRKWNYIYLFINLFKREIIGQSVGAHKTADLVYEALASVNRNLRSVHFKTRHHLEWEEVNGHNVIAREEKEESLSQKEMNWLNNWLSEEK